MLRKDLDRCLAENKHPFEWNDIKQDLRALKRVEIEEDGQRFAIRSECKGTPLSENYLYKQWKKACADLGIYDLDLYGGTRHSTTTAIAKELGKDRARKFSGHHTDKAFDRYCQIVDEDTFDSAQIMAKIRGKVINLSTNKINHTQKNYHFLSIFVDILNNFIIL